MKKRYFIVIIIILCIASVSAANAEDISIHKRRSMYIGFGFGGGLDARYKINNKTITFDDWLEGTEDKSPKFSFNFKIGATLNPKTLLGLDLNGVSQSGSVLRDFIIETKKVDATIGIYNLFLMITHFPRKEGFFIRGGGGYSTISYQIEGLDEDIVDGVFGRISESSDGYGLLGGVGYAFWLGKRFNLTINLDHSRQFYSSDNEKPDKSQFTIAYLGFDWY